MISILNASVAGWEAALGRPVFVFMASDTQWAIDRARDVFGARRVLTVDGHRGSDGEDGGETQASEAGRRGRARGEDPADGHAALADA